MRLGVLLPTFEAGAEKAMLAAHAARAAGLDGVFAYDHLWPMGSPRRPALAPFPVLAAVATRYEDLVVGTLVARVGLVSTEHLVTEFATLNALAPGRVIAALGTGDHLSLAENDAYGVVRLGANERRSLLRDAAVALVGTMPVWLGAGAEATNELARDVGAVVNLWNATPEAVAAAAARGPVSWAGPASSDVALTLDALARAGSTWAVFTPQTPIEPLGEWRRRNALSTLH